VFLYWLKACLKRIAVARTRKVGCVLLLFFSILLISGCSIDPPKSHYNKKMPRINRGYHIVKTGDTIYQIAWRYGWDYKELAIANDLKKPYLLQPNQRIKLYLSPRSKGLVSSTKAGRSPRRSVVTTRAAGTRTQLPSTGGGDGKSAESINWHWPVKGIVLAGFKANNPLHQGLKIGTPEGSKVSASAAGEVVYVGAGIRGLEKLIIVEHSNGFLSAYAHNRKIIKKEGEKVKAGEIIAETGSNGSGKAVLYFEIRSKGVSVDPKKYLP
jgi:lipoprotein NlpD